MRRAAQKRKPELAGKEGTYSRIHTGNNRKHINHAFPGQHIPCMNNAKQINHRQDTRNGDAYLTKRLAEDPLKVAHLNLTQ